MTRYELLERIGAGRMAEIFRARAVAAGGFEKPVAIKRILPELSKDPRFVELLIAEAKILSALRHRNIVQIFDVGLGDDGTYFLVMEYVDGVDLGVVQRAIERRRTRLPIDLVLHIGAEVCDALDHAQQTPTPDGRPMNLVHRDVSPSNVLVSRSGEVKLTDFGLARRPEDRRTAGGLRGRFGYVSPEQVAGLPVDGRSDVFSLGVMVWELALGRRLFSGMADYEALRAITDVPIPPPSTQDRALPAELDAILAEALNRDVDRRLPSAGELGKRLRGLRYSLESSSGDPAATLARTMNGIEREPLSLAASLAASGEGLATAPPFDSGERSVVKIRTAEVFAQRDPDGTGLLEARRVIEAFEEAETRMSSLPVAFDDISSTGGHSLRALEERTELTAPPMHLGADTGEVPITGEVGRYTGEVRDTGVTATVEGPTSPATSANPPGTLIDTLRGGVPLEVLRAAGGEAPGGVPLTTLRGGQVAPQPPPPARTNRAATSTPTPVREAPTTRAATPVREPPTTRAATPAREREASSPARRGPGEWGERIGDRGIDDDWTERTPPPPLPPGAAEPDPSQGAPLLGSLSPLLPLLKPAPSGPPLPGLSPTALSIHAAQTVPPSLHTAPTIPPLSSPAHSPPSTRSPVLSPNAPAQSPPSTRSPVLSPNAPAQSPPSTRSPVLSPNAPAQSPPSTRSPVLSPPEPAAASSPALARSSPSLAPAPLGPAPLPGPPLSAAALSSPGLLGTMSPPLGSPAQPSPLGAMSPPHGSPSPLGAMSPPHGSPSLAPPLGPPPAGPGPGAMPADEPASDPSRSYPPAGSLPWGGMPWPPPSGPLGLVRRWWPVAVGAVAIAILSFVITQAAIDPDVDSVRSVAPDDAGDPAPLEDAAALPALAVDAGPAGAVVDAAAGAAVDDAAATSAADAGAAADGDAGLGEAGAAGAELGALDAGTGAAGDPVDAGTATAPALDAGAAPSSGTTASEPTRRRSTKVRKSRRERDRERERERDRERARSRTRRDGVRIDID